MTGSASQAARNHIHHVGPLSSQRRAPARFTDDLRPGDEQGFPHYRNQIHDAPYCGIIGGGGGHRIEENLIYRVMRELHDGGAIYGAMSKSVLRRQRGARCGEAGRGYGRLGLLPDEGAHDSVVERNVSIGRGAAHPQSHRQPSPHRNNTFIAEKDMTLSFQRSADCAFTGNTLFVPGRITVVQPNAITS